MTLYRKKGIVVRPKIRLVTCLVFLGALTFYHDPVVADSLTLQGKPYSSNFIRLRGSVHTFAAICAVNIIQK